MKLVSKGFTDKGPARAANILPVKANCTAAGPADQSELRALMTSNNHQPQSWYTPLHAWKTFGLLIERLSAFLTTQEILTAAGIKGDHLPLHSAQLSFLLGLPAVPTPTIRFKHKMKYSMKLYNCGSSDRHTRPRFVHASLAGVGLCELHPIFAAPDGVYCSLMQIFSELKRC
jgi:hypothetical protein